MNRPEPLLKIEDLAVSFDTEEGTVRAVNGVDLTVYPQQTLAVVGESGCGKSVTALAALQLIPTPPGRYDGGRILFDGQELMRSGERRMQHIRGAQIAMIFQEPMTSLNPVYTIGEQILEAILLHQRVNRAAAVEMAEQALRDVGIADPRSRLHEYPHQMSGGMRQRIMVAMALACRPRLLLADEPTTALDVTIQAQILELLRQLQDEHGMSLMLITHDLGVVAENADVVAVMYAGRVVEYGTVDAIFGRPLHPYTRGLFESIPKLGEAQHRLATIPGAVPNPAHLPAGCAFHPRCDRTARLAREAEASEVQTFAAADAADVEPHRIMAACTGQVPDLLEVEPDHWVACLYAEGYAAGRRTRPDLPFRRTLEPSA